MADVTHDFVASVDHAPPDSTSADTGDQKCDREPFSENASVVRCLPDAMSFRSASRSFSVVEAATICDAVTCIT